MLERSISELKQSLVDVQAENNDVREQLSWVSHATVKLKEEVLDDVERSSSLERPEAASVSSEGTQTSSGVWSVSVASSDDLQSSSLSSDHNEESLSHNNDVFDRGVPVCDISPVYGSQDQSSLTSLSDQAELMKIVQEKDEEIRQAKEDLEYVRSQLVLAEKNSCKVDSLEDQISQLLEQLINVKDQSSSERNVFQNGPK